MEENDRDIEVFENSWMIRVSDLRQYDYCPRVVYYQYCTPGVRPITYKMERGTAAQDRVTELEQRRSLRAYGVEEGVRHFYVSVVSRRLGCSGQIDLVVETQDGGEHRLIPVDFKMSRREPGRHFKLQLACYGIMLEEAWNLPVREGYLYLIPARRAVRVPLTNRLRNDAERTIGVIREMILSQRMPPPVKQRSRCVDCEFRRFCNDVI